MARAWRVSFREILRRRRRDRSGHRARPAAEKHQRGQGKTPLRPVSVQTVAADCDFVTTSAMESMIQISCCYRCLQMVLANAFRESDSFALPSIEDIQRQLVVPGRQTPDKVGTSTWIEPPDCAAG